MAHTGAQEINNAMAQALLAKRVGKTRVVAATGSGQHGVATATACALLGMECTVFMGAVDCQRQKLNLVKIKILGAQVTYKRMCPTVHVETWGDTRRGVCVN